MEDERSHLIERAAARFSASNPALLLDQPAKIAVPSLGLGLPAGDAPLPHANGHSLSIDEAALMNAGLIAWQQQDNRVAEEFRIVQNELLQQELVGEAGGNIIMVTSALQGEGKSFTALNLSAGIARHGQRRVLLVDADFKAGALGHLLAAPEMPGLLDIAGDSQIDIGKLTLRTAIENLDFLPVGNSEGRNTELLSSRRMGDLVRDIGGRYPDRLVILDAPPCLMSSAPNTLAAVVGRVILVVEANTTQEGDVNAALELLHNCQNLSLVLNKIPPWSGHSFGAYYG